MANIQFSEEAGLSSRVPQGTKGGMVGWLVRSKWAKDEKQAEYLLIGIAVVAFATMIFVLIFGSLRPKAVPPNPLEQTAIPGPTS
ncbi:MAG: hypothetical protein QG636_634 [Patescibacteria group bacterium]|jgi:hypothetical protein|nr:hypothetical protein [Patescibacteria group bacterium]